jgi:hypothetical protein
MRFTCKHRSVGQGNYCVEQPLGTFIALRSRSMSDMGGCLLKKGAQERNSSTSFNTLFFLPTRWSERI